MTKNEETNPPVIKLAGMHRERIRETNPATGHTPGPCQGRGRRVMSGTIRKALDLLYSTLDEEAAANATVEEIDASTLKFNEAVKMLEGVLDEAPDLGGGTYEITMRTFFSKRYVIEASSRAEAVRLAEDQADDCNDLAALCTLKGNTWNWNEWCEEIPMLTLCNGRAKAEGGAS